MLGVRAMLSLPYLLEEAKSRQLPLLKKRAILREYLQVMILSAIYKHELAKSMLFTGGTALRFFHSLPRFSEDLDFDTPGFKERDFKDLLDEVKKSLLREGLRGTILISAKD